MSAELSRRMALLGGVAAVVSACTTMADRSLSLATVADWRIADVTVEFAPDVDANLDNFETAISRSRLGLAAGGTGAADAPIDPAGGGAASNPQAERVAAMNASPEVKVQARAEAAKLIAERFRAVLAANPAGKTPVRLKLVVSVAQSAGDAAQLSATAIFENIKTREVMLQGGSFGHVRPSRRAQAMGAVIGGGLIGLAAVATVAAMQDGGRPEPFVDVCEVSATKLRDWLLKA